MEVKVNKSNNQKSVIIPKDNPLKEGDKVNVIKVESLNLAHLKNYFKENKEQFKDLKTQITEYYALRGVDPGTFFIDHFKKTFGIKEDNEDEFDEKYKLGDTWVQYNVVGDEIADDENFVNIEHYLSFESILRNEIYETEGERHEGYVFDKNKYTKEQLNNSAILSFYIKLKRLDEKERKRGEGGIFGELNFVFEPYGGDEHSNSWRNEKSNIRLINTLTENPHKEFYITIEPLENEDKIEYDISELI